MEESKLGFFEDGLWVTIGYDLDLENNFMRTLDLLVNSEDEFNTLLAICKQSKRCVSIVFDFRNEKGE